MNRVSDSKFLPVIKSLTHNVLGVAVEALSFEINVVKSLHSPSKKREQEVRQGSLQQKSSARVALATGQLFHFFHCDGVSFRTSSKSTVE